MHSGGKHVGCYSLLLSGCVAPGRIAFQPKSWGLKPDFFRVIRCGITNVQRANGDLARRQTIERDLQSRLLVASTHTRIDSHDANRRGLEPVSTPDHAEKKAPPGLICQRQQKPARRQQESRCELRFDLGHFSATWSTAGQEGGGN